MTMRTGAIASQKILSVVTMTKLPTYISHGTINQERREYNKTDPNSINKVSNCLQLFYLPTQVEVELKTTNKASVGMSVFLLFVFWYNSISISKFYKDLFWTFKNKWLNNHHSSKSVHTYLN